MAVGGGRKRAPRWIAFDSQPFLRAPVRLGRAQFGRVGGELVAGSGRRKSRVVDPHTWWQLPNRSQ